MGIKDNIMRKCENFSQIDLKRFYKQLIELKHILPHTLDSDKCKRMKLLYDKVANVVFSQNVIDRNEIFSVIALEKILKSKEFNSIIASIESKKIYMEIGEREFNGNFENDISKLLIQFYKYVYVSRIQELKKLSKVSKNPKIEKQVLDLEQFIERMRLGKLTFSEIKKIREEQKQFFYNAYKKRCQRVKNNLIEEICINLDFLQEMGWMEAYARDYNENLKKIYLGSILKVDDLGQTIERIKKDLESLDIANLVAIDAFWTNRVAKEVSKISSIFYVLNKSGRLLDFLEDKEVRVPEETIKIAMAQYEAIRDKITKYKMLKKKENTTDNSNYKAIEIDLQEFWEEDNLDKEEEIGFTKELNEIAVLSQYEELIYDKKDILGEIILAYILNTKQYLNAGFIEDKESGNNRVLLGIDLKQYSAPIMIHFYKQHVLDFFKSIRHKPTIPLYKDQL